MPSGDRFVRSIHFGFSPEGLHLFCHLQQCRHLRQGLFLLAELLLEPILIRRSLRLDFPLVLGAELLQLLGDLHHALAVGRPHPPADISLDGFAVATHRSIPSGPPGGGSGWKEGASNLLTEGAPPHAGIRDRVEKAHQVEIDCGRGAFGHRQEAIPPTSIHANSPGNRTCDRL